MARGGIHDHVGGGFHRYSVDEDWFVPHFEKMLYDQAQIAVSALEAWQATGDERHAWLARDIIDYVRRDLTHPDGGFYSAEDADAPVAGASASAEGAFYLWTQAEIEAVLPPADAALFRAHYGIRPGGNVPAARDPAGEFAGRNIWPRRAPWRIPPGNSAWICRSRATGCGTRWSACGAFGSGGRARSGTTRSSRLGMAS